MMRQARTIAELCRQLDGIPVAIELAAACVRWLRFEGLPSMANDHFAAFSTVSGPLRKATKVWPPLTSGPSIRCPRTSGDCDSRSLTKLPEFTSLNWTCRPLGRNLLVEREGNVCASSGIQQRSKHWAKQGKPSIVFVHGLWADGSCFNKLIPTLLAEGHEVIAAQHGLDSHAADVENVRRTLKRVSSPVVLVGHSYGGSVITAAGTDSRVAALVYIAAFAPDADEQPRASRKSSRPPRSSPTSISRTGALG